MIKGFVRSVETAKKKINDPLFMLKNRVKNSYFTKASAKMSFKDAIFFILKGIKKTLQIEIDEWFEHFGGEITMTKQAFSLLRQKIKPDAFVELNDGHIEWIYNDDNFKKYRGYRLLSIDGSITEIPNTASNREYFGYYNNQSERLEIKGFKNDLFLFDRGYPSKDMFSFLERKQLKYLMRVKVNKF